MPLAYALLALALALPPADAAAPSAADPLPTAEVRDRVSAYLGAIHAAVSPQAFRELGPGAEVALADFARSDRSPIRRLRALEALAGLGGARAERVHREVLADGAAPRPVRRGAVRGLGRLLSPTAAQQALGPVLERDRDPSVRSAAAEVLAAAAPAEACARIRARARAEPEPSRFGRALATCDRAGGAAPAR